LPIRAKRKVWYVMGDPDGSANYKSNWCELQDNLSKFKEGDRHKLT